MAERLSRERVRELRRFVEWGRSDADRNGTRVTAGQWHDLLQVIDVYDAQRPRPASEAPEDSASVLVYGRRYPHAAPRWWVGHHAPYESCAPVGFPRGEWCEWRTDEHRVITAPIAWLPLPPVPERDDG